MSPGAPAGFHTTPCAPKLVKSVYLFLVVMKTSRHSLVIWSAVKKALDIERFFQKSLTFFNLKRRSELQKKTPEVGVLKSTQDFFENTVYSISLTTSDFVLPLNFSWLLYSV